MCNGARPFTKNRLADSSIGTAGSRRAHPVSSNWQGLRSRSVTVSINQGSAISRPLKKRSCCRGLKEAESRRLPNRSRVRQPRMFLSIILIQINKPKTLCFPSKCPFIGRLRSLATRANCYLSVSLFVRTGLTVVTIQKCDQAIAPWK